MDFVTGAICTLAEAETFQKTVVPFFRTSGYVERWAAFGAFPDMASGKLGGAKANPNGLMNTDSTPNALGDLFVSL